MRIELRTMGRKRQIACAILLFVVLPLSAQQSLPQVRQTAPLSAVFKSEIARLSGDGLQLKESVEASLDGTNRHLAVIFEKIKPKDPRETFEFRILESDGQSAATIFRRTEFFFTFASGEMSGLNANDINGDGLKEIILQSSSGGNCWNCNPTEIYRVKNHKVDLIAAGPIQRIVDLDDDGVRELLVTDARWEVYGDLSHAASPWAIMIYAWRNARYVNASRDFAAYYRGEIQRLRGSIEEAKTQISDDDFSDDSYIGRAIALALTYAHSGEPERGIAELERILKANVKSEEQSKRRATIFEDFSRGDSATKLRSIKYGSPLL